MGPIDFSPPYVDLRIERPHGFESLNKLPTDLLMSIDLHPYCTGPEIELTFGMPTGNPTKVAMDALAFEKYVCERVESLLEKPVLAVRSRDTERRPVIAASPLRMYLHEVLEQAICQDARVKEDPPEYWQPDRHGVRMFIAAMEDELGESYEAWDDEKKPHGPPNPDRWPRTRAELIQTTAIGLRAVRSLTPEDTTGVSR